MSFNKAKRRKFTPKQRQSFLQSHNCICHWCKQPIVGDEWDVEHIVARELLPDADADSMANLAPIHRNPCHKTKTRMDARERAKSNRIIARLNGTRRPRKAIASRGFEKSGVKRKW